MDEIALHIEFLLHTHDCVIVPGLGGFVVNVSNIERDGMWGIDAPKCELIFNNKLTYNDGLLAESLMKINNISFESANEKIDNACKELKDKLRKEVQVCWKNLGSFKGLTRVNEDNRPTFIPDKYYIRPMFYGLTSARLKPAVLHSSKNTYDKNTISLRPFIQYISSGIAIALLFFFIVVSYSNYGSKNQQAEMVSKSLIFSNNNSKVNRSKVVKSINEIKTNIAVNDKENILPISRNSDLTQSSASSNYYIIVGVYEVKDIAEKTLGSLKKKGFNDASILKRAGRLDVYSASFSDENAANDFLKKFRVENPEYNDAWLLER